MSGIKIALLIFILLFTSGTYAQGPAKSYFYKELTQLPWARCSISFKSGSSQQIPFLPLVNYFAPSGTRHYRQDVKILCPIVFYGQSLQNPSSKFSENIFPGKAAMIFYDLPDSLKISAEESDLINTIDTLLKKDVAAIVLCSYKNEFPFLGYQYYSIEESSDIPIITINRETAFSILSASGVNTDRIIKSWKEGENNKPRELLPKLDLFIKGKFDIIQGENGDFFFNRDAIRRDTIMPLVKIQDRAVNFITDLFKELEMKWVKTPNVYFADYDSKMFYTHHRGHAASHPTGNYYVYRNSYNSLVDDPYGLAVHENTHLLFFKNSTEEAFGLNNSFLFEGVAMYAQAMATDKFMNHKETASNIRSGNFYPLEEMLEFNIGLEGNKTTVGYPAAGSLVQYLIDTYGWQSFHEFWKTGNWEEAYGKNIKEIESGWVSYLLKFNKL